MTSRDMTPQEQPTQTGLPGKRDGDLLRLYTANGSQPAFAELRRRYARLVYSTCLRETGDATLAEDAVQGVFLLLSRKSRALEGRRTLVDWLYAASRYVSRNLRKQEQRRQMREARAFAETAAPSTGEAGDPLWEQVQPHLDDALGRLKPAERQAVFLRFVQQQSLAEVGACLGVSENTARMRVQRALEKIRVSLGRVGVVVSLTLLAALLLERAAPAVPLALLERLSASSARRPAFREAALAGAVRRASRMLSLLALTRPFAALILVAVIAAGYGFFSLYRPLSAPHLSPQEQHRAFRALDGIWGGRLEYADDRTGQHFTYPTTVTIRSVGNGSGLSFVATYAGSSAVDRTTFVARPTAGDFFVENSGPQSSHALRGVGELRRTPSGFQFQGRDETQDRDVRLRFTLGAKSLTMQEEYRLAEQGSYRFRNRFTLTRR